MAHVLIDLMIVSPTSETTAPVKQTAALCLLKLFRVDPMAISIDKHAPRLIRFLSEKNLV